MGCANVGRYGASYCASMLKKKIKICCVNFVLTIQFGTNFVTCTEIEFQFWDDSVGCSVLKLICTNHPSLDDVSTFQF